ncbi:MAG: CRISPR system precrRNA processing endoribonuclease RAMP protein Cas6 [Candidatus Aminicenantes bacterium]|nr:CRISPR system precrRNA processing endoribonuclease RAMP protein Cas6 [Candidatus Aminicenantes bacterium]
MVLKYLKVTFSLEPEEKIILPSYKGSALRGGFGGIFRKTVCVLKKEICLNCLLKDQCAYSYIFETSPPRDQKPIVLDKYEAIPKPFVIEPPKEEKNVYNRGERLNFNLILIGRAINYLPFFIIAFDALGQQGLGQKKGKFCLKEIKKGDTLLYSDDKKMLKIVEPEVVAIPYYINLEKAHEPESNEEEQITVEFVTPLRLKYQRDLVVLPEFHILIRNIMRRLWLLYYFHVEMKEPSWNHRQLIEAAKEIKIKENSLKWYDWERYSGRQKAKMLLGGLVGRIIYRGKIKPFLPLLEAGQILHVGKGTAFGLGEYRILEKG